MTDQPEPIRRSDLPPLRGPEWEFFTWFPLPDGGGDMVRGQRQRGVQVRRRVTYSDWEPVSPGRWAGEQAGEPGPNLAPGFVNPPGSTAEQLPADVLELIDPAPYLSTACGTAQALEEAAAEHPDRSAGLLEWAGRLHQRCRINNKFTGKLCACGHHGPS